MITIRDEFLSEEDLDLQNLSDQELETYWNYWLAQAQSTNDQDKNSYSHGVFEKFEMKAPIRNEVPKGENSE